MSATCCSQSSDPLRGHESFRRVLWAVLAINAGMFAVEFAATAKVIDNGTHTADLPATTTLLDRSILGGLDSAVDPLLSRIQSMAAVGADVRHLMDALPPLAREAASSGWRSNTNSILRACGKRARRPSSRRTRPRAG